MSSFVLLTKDGPPELMVEVGSPFSKDPVLLTGMFRAIVTMTQELTETPLQVIQTKGFTVKFTNLHDNYILMVGTNHSVVNLDAVLKQIEEIVKQSFQHNVDQKDVRRMIKDLLDQYIEKKVDFEDKDFDTDGELDEQTKEDLQELPKHIYKIIYFGLLAGYDFTHPDTPSLDYNREITRLLEYLEKEPCSKLAPTSQHAIELYSKNSEFKIDNHQYQANNVIKSTGLLKDLVKLSKKGHFAEMKSRIKSELNTIKRLHQLMENFTIGDEKQLEKINQIRHVLGLEIEHYALLRLQKTDSEKVKYFQKNVSQVEWVSTW